MALEFPQIDPVALSLGPFDIRWYALAYLSAFLLGWGYCKYLIGNAINAKPETPSKDDIDDFISWAIIGVIIGGRLGYVLIYQPAYYFSQPMDIIKLWEGGMSFHGGLFGMILSMFIYSRIKNILFFNLADTVACAAPIGLFFGRIANFINSELYGRISTEPWAIIFPNGGGLPRHPSQIYEALLEGMLLFFIMLILALKFKILNKPGMASGIFLIFYSVFRTVAEFFREPDIQIGLFFNAVSMGQILSIPTFIIGCILILFSIGKSKNT